MGLCDDLLGQKIMYSGQLETLDTAVATAWLAALAADQNSPLTGGPAASNSVIDVQFRIEQLYVLANGTDQTIKTAAMNALLSYQNYLGLVQQRQQIQNLLNNVVLLMLQNNCPLG